MKYTWSLAPLLIGAASAYPQVAELVAERQTAPDPNKRFNPKKQIVPIDGEHKFVPPNFEAGDVRGPCPGLNAMANHGYLPHNGVGTHVDFIEATYRVFGMSLDLSGFLTVLGATVDGNGLEWSIGGISKALPGAQPLIGTPQGISGSHNKYEADVSPGRGDLYLYGNDFELVMENYQQLYDMAVKNGDHIDLPLLTEFRSKRFEESIARNPYFFNGPFTGVQVQPAAYTFIFRFMGNKSEEHPEGKLNTDIMNSFFGVVKKSDGTLHKQPGHEKIPYNWYKRAIGDEYSIPFFEEDLLLAAKRYPKFLTVGGNLGKVNTFTGVNPKNISGGVYDAKDLSKGHNAACFSSQFLHQALPDMLKCSGVLANIEGAMSKFTKQLHASFGRFDCPKIDKIDESQFSQFPGYTKLQCKSGKYTG